MKRVMCILLSVLLIFSFVACAAEEEPEPTPTPTPNPLEAYSGTWTWEFGDGSVEWILYDDGRILVPQQTYDGYRSIGGFGTWDLAAEGINMTLAETYPLQHVREDGFDKLYCPLLNQTLVRTEEREAAYAAKYVDVTLTSENLWEYFRLEKVPSPVDADGNRIYKEVFVMRSVPYDNGLVHWSEEEVRLDFVYWSTYGLHVDGAPYGVNFYVNRFNSAKAEGTLTFVKADHVAEYTYDGAQRVVVLNSGETLRETFETFRYGNYPY